MFLELLYIIILFGLITLVWLCAGFHLAYGNEEILITFMVLDGILVRICLKQFLHLQVFVELCFTDIECRPAKGKRFPKSPTQIDLIYIGH